MRPQHRLRPRGGARGILHGAGRQRIGRPARPVGAVGEQGSKLVAARGGLAGRGRRTRIVRYHRDPAQVLAMRGDDLGISGLGDGGDRAAMVGKILHLRRRRAGVGGDRDGAELDAGEPGQHRLDAVIQMDQYEFARLDAAPAKAGGERADAVVKFAITPCSRRRVERRPDQERMVAADFGAHLQQPGHVEPRERSDDAGRCAVNVAWFLPRGLGMAALVRCLGSSSATGSRGGQMAVLRDVPPRHCEPPGRANVRPPTSARAHRARE